MWCVGWYGTVWCTWYDLEQTGSEVRQTANLQTRTRQIRECSVCGMVECGVWDGMVECGVRDGMVRYSVVRQCTVQQGVMILMMFTWTGFLRNRNRRYRRGRRHVLSRRELRKKW